MTPETRSGPAAAAARSLLSAAAVRERAHEMLAAALAGEVAEWGVDLAKLEAAADLTALVVREAYPDLNVPFHARWRHFAIEGSDLLGRAGKAVVRSEATGPRSLRPGHHLGTAGRRGRGGLAVSRRGDGRRAGAFGGPGDRVIPDVRGRGDVRRSRRSAARRWADEGRCGGAGYGVPGHRRKPARGSRRPRGLVAQAG